MILCLLITNYSLCCNMNSFSVNSVSSFSSFLQPLSFVYKSAPRVHFQSPYNYNLFFISKSYWFSSIPLKYLLLPLHPLSNHQPAISAVNDGAISVIDVEDFTEKDWSFLDPTMYSDEEYRQRTDKIILAGGVEETSKVLISFGSETFVDRLVDSSPCEQLFVVHDSLLILALIKEKYDKVKCWQGELVNVPQKWAPFDVVFLNCLPALPFELGHILGILAKQCLPGARLVINLPQGRLLVEEHRRQYPDLLVSDLPDELTLVNIAADNSFDVVKFLDEPDFYLALLKRKTDVMK